MNLKEEINKVKGTGYFCNCMDYEDAISIAEAYAKEKVLDAVKAFKPKVPITSVLKWWEDNK
jgi:hypothetical protein